jgi:hypothetical protein
MIRPASERGVTDWGWLDSRHTFSFGDYHDPAHIHYRSLRVINDDRIAPGGGFPTHPHRDMEIVTVVLEGGLEHRDSLGNGSIIRPDEVQRMTAGTGITHSEFNPSEADRVHLLQIWLMPERHGLTPSYEQTQFPDSARQGRMCLVASRDGREGSVTIHQDADLYVTRLEPGAAVHHHLAEGRFSWVHIATGAVNLNGLALSAGDGAAVRDEGLLTITGESKAEVLVFDLA